MDEQHKEHLLAIPQVHGVGRGLKEIKGRQTEQEAIMVLVKEKVAPEKLSAEEMVPKTINGVPTDVIEVGEIKALGLLDFLGAREEFKLNRFTRSQRVWHMRPAVPGVSIGHYLTTAGTFGALVYDEKTGKPYILSNNHVLANSSNGRDGRALLGDPILQPGRIDGGDPSNDVIATLAKYVTLEDTPAVNEVDCALAKPLNDKQVKSDIMGIGNVKGCRDPLLGEALRKSGRTTGITEGRVRAVDVTSNVSYGEGRIIRFENQILTTPMSKGGDSGSLVLAEGNMAVGLLFAGSDKSTLVNPIGRVLTMLGVKL